MQKRIPKCSPQAARRFKEKLADNIDVSVINKLTHNQYSAHSANAMANDWNLFRSFCEQRNIPALPASVDTIKRFIVSESSDKKRSTIRRYIVSVGLIHKLVLGSDPTKSREVKLELNHQTADEKHKSNETQPLTEDDLCRLKGLLKHDQRVKDLRDLTFAYIMFELALKRKEVIELEKSDVQFDGEVAKIAVGYNIYPASNELSSLLRQWLSKLDDDASPVFRAIDRHENISMTPIDASGIYRVFARIANMLGLPNTHKLSGQSARVGQIKKLGEEGRSTNEIRLYGRYSSIVMPLQYIGYKPQSETEKLKHIERKDWE
ncbi:tyrosine-type recombinase/integrase [Vibrio mediterranei]|uniref:tyrosine-type recombinase/integrase n=1 Tax=Vibrio mediterranei TaxID=689 RepID=UPI004067F876